MQGQEPVRDTRDVPTTQKRRPPTVVLAEDDEELRAIISSELQRDGFRVVEITDGETLLSHLATCDVRRDYPALIITDNRMPGYSGLEVLAGLQQTGWNTPIILITAYGDPELRDLADELGAVAVLDKPVDVDMLRTAAHWCLERPT
jgi:CheY-like chemotaxis protein